MPNLLVKVGTPFHSPPVAKVTGTGTYAEGSEILLSVSDIKEGFQFVAWIDANGGGATLSEAKDFLYTLGASNKVIDAWVRPKPTIIVNADKYSGRVPLTVNFDSSKSYDDNAPLSNFRWYPDWDNQGWDLSVSAPVAQHTYTSPGVYSARATVYNGWITQEEIIQITVGEEGSELIFDYEGEGYIEEVTAGPYSPQDQVTAIAHPSVREGFGFKEWQSGGIVVGTDPEFSTSGITEDLHLTAIFIDLNAAPVNEAPEDLYDSCIKFRLVKNLKKTITPLSVVRDEFFQNYDFVEIIEPIGWDAVHLETQRDRDNHGFTATIGVEELTFRCNTGQEFIEVVENSGGSDTNLKLIVTENDKYVAAVQLNFEEYRKDIKGVHLSVEESPFDGLFATRKDVKYPFTLDKQIFTYSPARLKQTSWGYFEQALQWSGITPGDPMSISGHDSLIYFNILANRENHEIETAHEYPASILTRSDGTDYNNPHAMTFTKGGKVKISIDLGMVAYFRDQIPSGGVQLSDQINLLLEVELLTYRTEGRGQMYEIGGRLEPTETFFISHYDTLGKGPVENQEPDEFPALLQRFQYEWEVTVFEGDKLFIQPQSQYYYDWTELLGVLPNQGVAAYVVNDAVNVFSKNTIKLGAANTGGILEVVGEFVGRASITNSSTLKNIMGEVSTKMLEVDINPVVSDIGEDEILHLSTGHAIRNAEEEKDYTASFFDLFGGAKPLMGLGYNVEIKNLGEQIKLDYTHNFYKADRAVGLIHDLTRLNMYEEKADIGRTYNEVSSGYSKFSKERETNKRLTVYDVHGKHEYLTPIRKTKNEKELISNFIASQYTMDDLRLKQFEQDAKEAYMREDDDLFMLTTTGLPVSEIDVVDVQWLRGLGKIVMSRGGREARDLGSINGFSVKTEGILPVIVGEEVSFGVLAWQGLKFDRVIRDINYQPVSHEGNEYVTIIRFDELTEEESSQLYDNVELRLEFTPRLIPESEEPFSTIEGVKSSETAYNLRYTPKRILLNNHKEINVGLLKKEDTDEITAQNIEGFGEVSTQFKPDEEFVGGDTEKQLISESSDIQLINFGARERLHQPYVINLKYSDVSYEFYTRILLAHKTESLSSYGLIEVSTPFGELVRGFLDICKYYPGARTMELTLLLYDRRQFTPGEYLADVDGTFILTTKGEFIIVET